MVCRAAEVLLGERLERVDCHANDDIVAYCLEYTACALFFAARVSVASERRLGLWEDLGESPSGDRSGSGRRTKFWPAMLGMST